MNNNMNKFEENKNVSVNEQQEVAQVENKKSVMGKIVGAITNKYTLIGLGTVAVGYLGYKGYQIWKAKKAASQELKEDGFEDVTEKK
jgi:uncharacterized membrane protein YebE (DUF533 family)